MGKYLMQLNIFTEFTQLISLKLVKLFIKWQG